MVICVITKSFGQTAFLSLGREYIQDGHYKNPPLLNDVGKWSGYTRLHNKTA